ncbi:MAG: BMP family ABC transporter substrate-binding protein [Actinobacteria bacterium]|jgi:basic membrane protein A|nr:BMP family ABC transporter substrate-binding protein [Actinomycetota bacterium]NCZ91533.1 BMP family ABC transporter substrate-binding protein [Actinomycetota bacterium]
MRKQTFKGLAVGLVAVLGLAACGSDDASTDTTAAVAAPTGLACEVTDIGGVDDKGFNQIAYEGLKQAESELGVSIDLLESASDADYAPNLQSFVDKGCNVIVTVGFLLADATKAAAEANPGVQFAIVDSNTSAPNVQGLTFATDQPSFLAGYMAAATTQTGIVGTFGGINIPPVAIFMQGFAKGVEYYNAQKGASVKVLGWDMAKQDGTFAGNFNNLDDGKNIAKSQADEGADIIFPVAGPVGLGASAYAMESGGKVKIIGVDVDMTQSNPEQAEVYVASVLKKIDAAVLQAVKDALAGQGGGTDYLGTLSNGGVGVAITSTVTPELQAELDAITAGIIDGSIATS